MKYGQKSLLRFVTTGSVDDGKSTLIGRLLYETKSIYEDQLEAVQKTSLKKGLREADLALLLDGLSAEREQGITIDVAHRYFETPIRKFIIADCPGHVQYTRNMVTGASTAECAIILIDARNGVLTQSRRHGFLVSLLQTPHMVVAVNKMDLVGYAEEVFSAIVQDYRAFSEKLDIHDISFIPVSALKGDNVVNKSRNMPWYEGPTILHYLENVHVAADRNLIDFRFPVQYVIRPHLDFRGFAGRIVSGTVMPGEELVVLPSGRTSKVRTVTTYEGDLEEAFAPQSVVLTLDDEIDVSRGDMLVRTNNLPHVSNHFEAMICWMDEEAMTLGASYLLKHTTRTVKAFINRILYKIDVNTLHRDRSDSFALNEIGRVEIKTSQPVFFDPYRINQGTGSFILIDPLTNHTLAAGVIRGAVRSLSQVGDRIESDHLKKEKTARTFRPGLNISRENRENRNRHKAAVLWLTGYSGAGKTTIARALEKELFTAGCQIMVLDGDDVRQGLCNDLGFSDDDRRENIRRIGEVAKLFFESGHIVLCAFISPFRRDREFVRSLIRDQVFIEVYIKCDLSVCKARDPKNLYKSVDGRQLSNFTGIDSPYEEPLNPDIIIDTEYVQLDDAVCLLSEYLKERDIIESC